MCFGVNRPVRHSGACGVFAKIVVAFPILRWSDGSRHKATTAIRTDVVQELVNTGGTERTLIGTDPCFKRSRWQRLVAILASWSELKHDINAPLPQLNDYCPVLRTSASTLSMKLSNSSSE